MRSCEDQITGEKSLNSIGKKQGQNFFFSLQLHTETLSRKTEITKPECILKLQLRGWTGMNRMNNYNKQNLFSDHTWLVCKGSTYNVKV